MKTIFLSIIIILTYGCDGAYPNEKGVIYKDGKGKSNLVFIEIGDGYNGYIDSITLIKDTLRVYSWYKDRIWYNTLMHPKDSFHYNQSEVK